MNIDDSIWRLIEEEYSRISYGTLTLIVRDENLIQIDKIDKIRIGKDIKEKSSGKSENQKNINTIDTRRRINAELKGLAYGQIILVIADNKITHIERIERHRLKFVEGQYGDGI